MQKLVAGQSLELRFPELQLYADKSYQNNAADGADESDDNSSTTSTLDEGNVFSIWKLSSDNWNQFGFSLFLCAPLPQVYSVM